MNKDRNLNRRTTRLITSQNVRRTNTLLRLSWPAISIPRIRSHFLARADALDKSAGAQYVERCPWIFGSTPTVKAQKVATLASPSESRKFPNKLFVSLITPHMRSFFKVNDHRTEVRWLWPTPNGWAFCRLCRQGDCSYLISFSNNDGCSTWLCLYWCWTYLRMIYSSIPIVDTKYPLAHRDSFSYSPCVLFIFFFIHADDFPLSICMA